MFVAFVLSPLRLIPRTRLAVVALCLALFGALWVGIVKWDDFSENHDQTSGALVPESVAVIDFSS
jgi:hypothetical protein